MLVVVEDRNIHQFSQPLLDDEALRRFDVLEVDAAETREVPHGGDEFVGVFGRNFQIDGINVGEALEQHRLAFHDGLGRQRAEIAEPQNGRAIGDHGDKVGLCGVIEGERRVFGDGKHGHGHARRIGER